jgi:hypothetical protein
VLLSEGPRARPLCANQIRNPWLYVEGSNELIDTRERAGRRIRPDHVPVARAAPGNVPPPPAQCAESGDRLAALLEFRADVWREPIDGLYTWDDFGSQ